MPSAGLFRPLLAPLASLAALRPPPRGQLRQIPIRSGGSLFAWGKAGGGSVGLGGGRLRPHRYQPLVYARNLRRGQAALGCVMGAALSRPA